MNSNMEVEPRSSTEKRGRVIRQLFKTVIVILLVVSGLTAAVLAVLGPISIPAPSPPTPTPTPTPTVGNEHVAALNATIEQMRYLLGGLGLLLTIVVSIQAYVQFRHDDSATQVSGILSVVRDTLQTRLDAEKAARREATALQTKILDIESGLEAMNRLRASIGGIVRTQRDAIETSAESLAKTPRHGFRTVVERLTTFARQYDTFMSQFRGLEEQPQEFSGTVLYIRGIAAHVNEPDKAQLFLSEVTRLPRPDHEPEDTYQRRMANAFYYLGVTSSNFGDVNDATAKLREAIRRHPRHGEYLTRVVAAEALVMAGRTDEAKREAQEIVDLIDDQSGGLRLVTIHRRLRSRAILVQANAAIVAGRDTYAQEVDNLLRPVLEDDPEYYYAIATLAQVTAASSESEAADLFRQAFDCIISLNDLHTVTEVRSRILLHMTAALCLRAGARDTRHSDEHLDRANELRDELPRLHEQPCTVFSVLTKFNETSAAIQDHIGQIREGRILMPGRLSTTP